MIFSPIDSAIPSLLPKLWKQKSSRALHRGQKFTVLTGTQSLLWSLHFSPNPQNLSQHHYAVDRWMFI